MIPAAGAGSIKRHALGKVQCGKLVNHRSRAVSQRRACCQIIVKSRIIRYTTIGGIFKNFRLLKQGECFALLGAVGGQGVVGERPRRRLIQHIIENGLTADIGIIAVACIGIRIIGLDLPRESLQWNQA